MLWSSDKQVAAQDVMSMRRRTVFCSEDDVASIELGVEENAKERTPRDLESLQKRVEVRVAAFVKSEIAQINKRRAGAQWTDPEFGPDVSDPLGARSLFRNGRQGAPGYPKPTEIVWKRPSYVRDAMSSLLQRGDEECYCKNAKLFYSPASEATIVQGQLGDCWFLNAVTAAAMRPNLVESIFWRFDDFKDYGLFVCRFYKNSAWYYVVIDDRIPIFACADGQPCFARTRNSSEVWLPLLEKAYAKLHFSYDSLTGGAMEQALRDLTGWATQKVLLGALDANSSLRDLEVVWRQLRTALDYGSAVGCLVRPEDCKEAVAMQQQLPSHALGRQVSRSSEIGKSIRPNKDEGSALMPSALRGLELRHAYGLLAAKTINNTKIVLVHNPWGFGQWMGPWSQGSQEFKQYTKELECLFPLTQLQREDCFLMSWNDFASKFTSMHVSVQLRVLSNPSDFISIGSQWLGGLVAKGQWTESTSGGGVDRETWTSNPMFRIRIEEPQTRVFIQLALKNRRIELGKTDHHMLFSFTICNINPHNKHSVKKPSLSEPIAGSSPAEWQPTYTYSSSCDKEVILMRGDYAIVPHTLDRGHEENFILTIYFDKRMSLESALPIRLDENNILPDPFAATNSARRSSVVLQDAGALNGGDESLPNTGAQETDQSEESRTMSLRAERFKERLTQLATHYNIRPHRILATFQGYGDLTRFEFKDQLVSLGFSVSELPDDDFEALAYPGTVIDRAKVRSIFEQYLLKQSLHDLRPDTSTDDLMFRPPTTAPGQLTVHVHEAKDLVLTDTLASKTTAFASDVSQKLMTSVFRSKVLQTEESLVILTVWRINTTLDKPVDQGDVLCVPIIYNISDGKDYALEEPSHIWVFEHQVQDSTFWEAKTELWCGDKKKLLDLHPLENQFEDSDGRSIYVSNRNGYVEQVVKTLRESIISKSQFAPSPTEIYGDSSAPTVPMLAVHNKSPKVDKRLPFALSLSMTGKIFNTPELREADKNRNIALFRLRSKSGYERKTYSADLSKGKFAHEDLTKGEKEEFDAILTAYQNKPSNREDQKDFLKLPSGVGDASAGPDAAAGERPSNTQSDDIKASDVNTAMEERSINLDKDFCSGVFEDIFNNVFEAILFGRELEIKYSDPSCKSASTTDVNLSARSSLSYGNPGNTNERLIYSTIAPVSGEAKVLKEQLSRSENLRAWFAKFDKDHNGKIDPLEFQHAMEALGFALNSDDMQILLTHLDKDGDGNIDPQEFISFVDGDTDASHLEEREVYMEDLLSTLGSSGVKKDAVEQTWSVGIDWFKLRHFASQLSEFTLSCASTLQRTYFSGEPKVVALRAYRVAHLFKTPAAFQAFLNRHHLQGASLGSEPLVQPPKRARQVFIDVLMMVQTGKLHVDPSATISPGALNIDVILGRLPKFIEQTLGMAVPDLKSGPLTSGVLTAYAKAQARAKLAELRLTQKFSDEEAKQREEEETQSFLDLFTVEVENSNEHDDCIRLTLSEEMCMLIDDAFLYCKSNSLTKSVLIRILSPDRTRGIELKLRHILQTQDAIRNGPSLFLIDVYAQKVQPNLQSLSGTTHEKLIMCTQDNLAVLFDPNTKEARVERLPHDNSETHQLRVHIFNPCTGRRLELQNVELHQSLVMHIPKLDLKTDTGGWSWFPPGSASKPDGWGWFKAGYNFIDTKGGPFESNELQWEHLSKYMETPGRKIHTLEDLTSRLVIRKATSITDSQLMLSIRECPRKADFIKKLLDNLNNSPFFTHMSDSSLHFRVNCGYGQDCKHIVLDALRSHQGGRLATILSSMSSLLDVVFEQTHGDFREQMCWSEFAAYLAEKRNTAIRLRVMPGDEGGVTPAVYDGGFNPGFGNFFLQVPFSPPRNTNRNLVCTRVCKIETRYIILFVHHVDDPGSTRLGLVAYDPRSNDEYTVNLKTAVQQSRPGNKRGAPRFNLRPYMSPKKNTRKPSVNQTKGYVSKASADGASTREYAPETLALLDRYPLLQEDLIVGVQLEASFPLQNDNAWDEVVNHLCLGICLTPHVEATVLNIVGADLLEIGKARLPLAGVTNHPGQSIHRWLTVCNKEGKEAGKVSVTLRFDDSQKPHSPSLNNSDENRNPLIYEEKGNTDGAGDEAMPEVDDDIYSFDDVNKASDTAAYDLVQRRAQNVKDYTLLAQRLREEVLEAKAKLADSERARATLEATAQKNEARLAQTRNELEQQQRKLREAEDLVSASKPRRKLSQNANSKEIEDYRVMEAEHAMRLRELDALRGENDKLRHLTDSREARLREELREVQEKLNSTELKLRLTATEKQELLRSVEKANVEAQVKLAQQSTSVRPMSQVAHKSKEERTRDRQLREEWLQATLHGDYKSYRREMDKYLQGIEKQLRSRNNTEPKKPLLALERLLVSQATVTRPEPRIPEEIFSETLLNFGLDVEDHGLNMIKAHFTSHLDNNISIDEFIDAVSEAMDEALNGIATSGLRGLQTMQRQGGHVPWSSSRS